VSGFLAGRDPRPLTRRRWLVAMAACGAAAALAVLVAPLLSVELGPGGRHLTWLDTADPIEWMIYTESRLPRALAGLLVGGALAAAGCALQAILRNPLAEPFTLGISSGSSLAAVIAIRLGVGGALGGAGVGLAALLGAAAATAVVWQLGRVGRNLPPATLLLAGVTISMFAGAASMLIQHTADFVEVSQMLRWMMGSLKDVVGYGALARAAGPLLLGLAVLVWLARDLNALAGGGEAAASLGVATGRVETTVFVVASLLVGGCIALAGPIGFVGLMVPHALRAVLGPDHRLLLPASILGGGAFLALCDTVARVAAPDQLAVGIVTALLGGPFFVGILLAGRRRAELWDA
jgi:iron complex transport system permease protein